MLLLKPIPISIPPSLFCLFLLALLHFPFLFNSLFSSIPLHSLPFHSCLQPAFDFVFPFLFFHPFPFSFLLSSLNLAYLLSFSPLSFLLPSPQLLLCLILSSLSVHFPHFPYPFFSSPLEISLAPTFEINTQSYICFGRTLSVLHAIFSLCFICFTYLPFTCSGSLSLSLLSWHSHSTSLVYFSFHIFILFHSFALLLFPSFLLF